MSSPATEPITPQVFEHLVQLAQFELDDEERDYLRRELNRQMLAIHQLEAIELPDSAGVTSHGVPYPAPIRPGLRADEIAPSEQADAILEQAPNREDRYLVVPDIPHEALE
jgi:aspartyl-tRNA(Asn)/glutamyl-tRNA(Gln) amidotransferase subunit C